ncbi:ATP-binding cassette domain-containing protein [Paraclostridium bifermentans]|nr:ATP-binding cassette domain-containing protein [Paraclostridium bifermentans]
MFLKLNNIKKEFSKQNGVTNIHLQINQGELVTLLGPSGCGKTTTLNIIGGFLKPDNGTIILEEEDITLLPPEKGQ